MLKFSILLSIFIISGLTTEISENSQQLILKYHRDLRSKVAKGEFFEKPKATNMRRLAWDFQLSRKAAKHAEQRPYEGNSTLRAAGVSIFHMPTYSNIEFIIKKFYLKCVNELRQNYWTPQNISSEMLKNAGHGLQAIHAKSSRIGCAYNNWNTTVRGVLYKNEVLVCVYNMGRIDKVSGVYEPGSESCSNCPTHTECEKRTGLCVGKNQIPTTEHFRLEEYIEDRHNDLRSSVARGEYCGKPKATNMRKIIWDLHLTKSAAKYAEKRIQKGDARFRDNGISIFHSSSSLGLATTAYLSFRCWQEQLSVHRSRWTPQNISNDMMEYVGDGLQMIHAGSSRIGCAFNTWNDSVNGSHEILVCVYSNGRIDRSLGVYEPGIESCTNCPRDTECEPSSGLCVVIKRKIICNPSDFELMPSRNREQIVVRYNNFRRTILQHGIRKKSGTQLQKATIMHELKWDNSLARDAHNFLHHCIYVTAHSKKVQCNQRGVTVHTFVGYLINEFIIKDSYDQSVKQLEEEEWNRGNYTFPLNRLSNLDSAVQMIFANSCLIGCAIKKWEYVGQNYTTFVCRYDPPMISGSEVYPIV